MKYRLIYLGAVIIISGIISCSKPKTLSIIGQWKLISIDGGVSNVHYSYASNGILAAFLSNRTYNYSTYNTIFEKGYFTVSQDLKVINLNNSKPYYIITPDEMNLYLEQKDSIYPYTFHYQKYP